MIRIWDGGLSLLAAVATLVVCGVPVWFTHVAVRGGLAPLWAYAPAGLLAAVGLIMVAAFGRKGLRGISPSRDRPR